MTDNRIVLPLDRVRRAAAVLCGVTCGINEHDPDLCLIPLLEDRERQLGTAYVGAVSPDCQSQKCAACTGCLHFCHRHSLRRAA